MVQGKNSFAVQFYSESLLGSRVFKIFPAKTVAKFPTCFPNIITSCLFNHLLCEAMKGSHLVSELLPWIRSLLLCSFLWQQSQDQKVNLVWRKKLLKYVKEDCVLRQRKQNIKGEDPATLSLDNDSIYKKQGYLSVIVLPFLLHLGFMSATSFFVMHVKVSTLLLSSRPPFYWFASYVMLHPSSKSKIWGYLIWAHCAACILLGSILFSKFYPFT
ncbi:hypothetical protein LguiB_021162 [Lonicera macranthoides]